MSGRDWGRANSRQQMQRQGVDSVADQAFSRPVFASASMRAHGEGDVNVAAEWLRFNRERLRAEGRHTVPALQRAFGLSTKQACEAIRLANELEVRR